MLVNRLVRLLLAGAKPDAILAITFTRKAAAEMQSRLSERLLALAAAPDDELFERLHAMGVEAEADTLERARRLFETIIQNRQTVRTTTFHAFCQEILLRFPLEADVPPGFDLLDSGAEQLEAAHAALFAEASMEPDGSIAEALETLLDFCGGLHGLQRSLNSFISHRGDWWAFTEDAADPVAFATENLGQRWQVTPAEDPLQHFFTAHRLSALAEFATLLSKHPTKGNQDALEAIASARNPDLSNNERFAACRDVFLTKQGAPRARKPSKTQAGKMGVEGQERFLSLHDELSQAILQTIDRISAHNAWQANSAWYRAGNRLLQHYQQLKQEQRVLDFSDLEWRAYRLLNHSENALWVQYKLDQRIDHLLVDEFQDTNPTQWRLLLPLLQEMAATEADTLRSVFLVGDAKQSIYRFRRAEPRLFHTAHDWLESHLNARTFPLHTSWRSAPAIMQGVNSVFGEHGPLHGRLRDFTEHSTHHSELWGEVKVLPLIEAEDACEEGETEEVAVSLRNPLNEPRELAADDRYRREGEQIAEAIRHLIKSGTILGHGENARPAHYGDIMLLVRKRTHIGYYEQALRDAGIPYIGAERGTLLHSLEVRDMVALLEVLHTPYNNLSLAMVLRSPLFDCSDEDLMQLAGWGKGGWYQRLLDVAEELSEHEALKIAAVTLQHWRELAGHIPIHDLVDRIFNEGNVLERYQAAFPPHLGNSAIANLTRFLELALEIDSGRYPSLGHFLSRLEGMRESSEEAPDEAPVSGGDSRVRLLTIHASKGLEAPVVFLADTALGSGNDKAYRTLIDWPPEAPRPTSFILVGKQQQQPAMLCQQLEREKQEQERESANLLYVAMTRARQLLYISGVKAQKGDECGWYGAIRDALDPSGEIDPGQICCLTGGSPPQNQQAAPITEDVEEAVTLDPALMQPFTNRSSRYEIAPSYQASEPHATSGSGDEEGRQRGIVIHRLLQVLTEHPRSNWPDVVTRVAAEFGFEANDRQLFQWFDECQQLLEQAALSDIFASRDGVESLNEVPIIYKHNGQTVHGVIDRLQVKKDEVWLVDYKTHRHANTENSSALAAGYRQQMAYYASGVRQLWPERKLRSFLLFTRPALLHEMEIEDPTKNLSDV